MLDTIVMLVVLGGVAWLIFRDKKRDKSGPGGSPGNDDSINKPK